MNYHKKKGHDIFMQFLEIVAQFNEKIPKKSNYDSDSSDSDTE